LFLFVKFLSRCNTIEDELVEINFCYFCAMNRTKRFSIYLFVALLLLVNVNYYRSNAIPAAFGQTGRWDGLCDQLGLQNSPLFSVIEQRGNLQIQFSSFQKNFFKITLPQWSLGKASFVIKAIIAETCYSYISEIIVPGLKKTEIIFPFHYFW
jgi:hypothetical protein